MKPLDLREFAENLYVSGTAQEMEFAKEIMVYSDFDVSETYAELVDGLERYAGASWKGTDPFKIIEWIGDRSDLLGEIEGEIIPEYAERLKMAGIECADVDDIIRALLDRLPTEWDL